jgi:hypothetical protein
MFAASIMAITAIICVQVLVWTTPAEYTHDTLTLKYCNRDTSEVVSRPHNHTLYIHYISQDLKGSKNPPLDKSRPASITRTLLAVARRPRKEVVKWCGFVPVPPWGSNNSYKKIVKSDLK